MLDPHGFVATCNSTHFFIVRRGELWTSSGAFCLGGITRATVLRVAREAGIPTHERNFSLTDVYGADEAFVTGHVRRPGAGARGRRPRRSATARTRPAGRPDRLRELYLAAVEQRRRRGRRPAAGGSRDRGRRRPAGGVVGPAQHLDRADAGVGEPPDTVVVDEPLYAHYLAVDRPRPPRPRRGDRGRRDRLARGRGRRCSGPFPMAPPSSTRSTWPTTCCPTSSGPGSRGLTNVLLIRDPREVVASYVALPGRRRPRRHRPAPAGRSCTTSWRRRARRRP